MKFISTRNTAPALSFEETILQGLAPDGGLYVPDFLPKFDEKQISRLAKMNYEEVFFEVTRHFVEEEIDSKTYKKIIEKSYKNFSHKAVAPLKQLSHNHFLLELFCGPTLAFKDFALQFLGNLLDHFLEKRGEKIVIIGATSGDTGSAAIQGCKACKNATIFILHPHEKVSPVQRKQMTSVLEKNVFNIALRGNFDDCQALVKRMFADEAKGENFTNQQKIIAINSINFARIMAQIAYYFYAATRLGCDEKNAISFSVPTGNFGDIYAGFLAREMGLNVKQLLIATNANDILFRFIANNDYRKSQMIETISPSMNIQVSSNFERLLFDFHRKEKNEKKMAPLMKNFEETGALKLEESMLNEIRKIFIADSISDENTKKTIKEIFDECGEILDPHTAIAVCATKNFMSSEKFEGEIFVSLATAHPAKFPDAVVEAGAPKPALPAFLQGLMEREEKFEILENNLGEVKKFISQRI